MTTSLNAKVQELVSKRCNLEDIRRALASDLAKAREELLAQAKNEDPYVRTVAYCELNHPLLVPTVDQFAQMSWDRMYS